MGAASGAQTPRASALIAAGLKLVTVYREPVLGLPLAAGLSEYPRVDLDAEGRATGFQGVLIDIDERREAELRIQDNEERLRLATEAAEVGFWDVDVDKDGDDDGDVDSDGDDGDDEQGSLLFMGL